MSLNLRNLSVLAYANGFTLWHYSNPLDSLDSVTRSGYLNDATDLKAGDMILLRAKDGARVILVSHITGDRDGMRQVHTANLS